MHKVNKTYWKMNVLLKIDQSDSTVTLMYPKSSKDDHKVSKVTPMTPKCPKVPRLTRLWRRRGPLDPSKFIGKIITFCLWARLGRTQGDMICITSAIRRLYAVVGVHFSLSGHCLPLFS